MQKTADEFDAWVVANATVFVATAFRGRGSYETRKAKSLEEARGYARQMVEDRPVGIYAIYRSHQVLVESIAKSDGEQDMLVHVIAIHGDTVTINGFTTKEEAQKRAEPMEGKKVIADEQKALEEFTSDELIKVYNHLAPRPIKVFHTKDKGIARVWAMLNHKPVPEEPAPAAEQSAEAVAPEAETSHSTTEGEDTVAAKSKKKVSRSVKTSKANGAGRAGRFKGDSKITLLAKENPKRKGTGGHRRFEKYKSGMTVADALKAGLTRPDLLWDSKHGFIKIS